MPPSDEKKALHAEQRKELASEQKKMLEGDTAKALEERIMRLQAEFENYKKRSVKENDMLREKASADAMLKLLPLADDFGMAVAHMDSASDKEFKKGIELIYAKLLDLLAREGVAEMECLGETFDPYRHDALRHMEGEDGRVVEVIQKGYLFRGKVLRHAKVAVGN
ncbi:MAG: nucleotide exchange factor GrpE, partial [Candidatus Micrarchaeota archaeon]